MTPPVILPDELGLTIEDIYRPVNAVLVPEIAGVLAHLAEHDPDVLAAVADVDRGLILAALELEPMERLHRAVQMAQDYDELAMHLQAQRASRQTA